MGFRSAEEMWREEIGLAKPDTDADANNNKRHEWYSKGISYWEVSKQLINPSLKFPISPFFFFPINSSISLCIQGVKASLDGVLGGYGHVNDADVKASDAFLKTFCPLDLEVKSAIL